MKKLAFIFGNGLDSFIKDIAVNLYGDYEAKLFNVSNEEDVKEAIGWGDILWFEWANEIAAFGTRSMEIKPDDMKVIVRLHSYEALTGLAMSLNWEIVDACVFVANHVRDLMRRQISALDEICKTYVIHNGVDTDKFRIHENKVKSGNVAFLGIINNKKGPMLLMHAIKALASEFPKLKFHIGGPMQEQRYNIYMGGIAQEWGITERVDFHGQISDVVGWMKDKEYMLVTSPWEGCPVGVLEAMSCGVRPLIHWFPGCTDLFPPEFIWRDLKSLVDMVAENSVEPQDCRDFVIREYGIDKQMKEIRAMLKEVTNG